LSSFNLFKAGVERRAEHTERTKPIGMILKSRFPAFISIRILELWQGAMPPHRLYLPAYPPSRSNSSRASSCKRRLVRPITERLTLAGSLGAQWEYYLVAGRQPYLQDRLSNSFTGHGRRSLSLLAGEGVGEEGETDRKDGGGDADDEIARTEDGGGGADKREEKKEGSTSSRIYKKQLSIVPDKHLKEGNAYIALSARKGMTMQPVTNIVGLTFEDQKEAKLFLKALKAKLGCSGVIATSPQLGITLQLHGNHQAAVKNYLENLPLMEGKSVIVRND